MEFRDFLGFGNVKTIERPTDPMLQAARTSGSDQTKPWIAPAKGCPGFRMAGNVFSSRNVLAKWFGIELREFPDMMIHSSENPLPTTTVDIPSYYREIDTDLIPIPKYFKNDGGPYITSGIFHSGYGGKYNLSFHRMMYLGGGRFAVRVVPRHLKQLLEDAEGDGVRLGAVISIGADPASLLAGSASADFGTDELEIASSLHERTSGEPLRVIEPFESGLKAPLGTEIVICGRFTGEKEPEGPFVDITSTYDRKGLNGQPVFKVEKALVRDQAIMHVLLPGGLEHFLLMGIPKEPSIMSSVRKVVPRVHSVRLTEGGCCWLHGVISIGKQKEGDAKNAIMAAFAGHPSMKRVIVVDADIDVFNDREVEWAMATRYQSERDLVVVNGARGSTLDPSASAEDGTTSKEGLDATVPLGSADTYRRIEE